MLDTSIVSIVIWCFVMLSGLAFLGRAQIAYYCRTYSVADDQIQAFWNRIPELIKSIFLQLNFSNPKAAPVELFSQGSMSFIIGDLFVACLFISMVKTIAIRTVLQSTDGWQGVLNLGLLLISIILLIWTVIHSRTIHRES